MQDLYNQEKNQVTKSAFWVALGTMTSRGLGFAREMIIAHYFTRLETDVFFVAFRIPNLFRRLFGEGALTISFIPVLTDFIKSDDKKGARELVSGVFTLLFIILSVLTLVGTAFPEWMVVPLTQGQGYSSIAGKVDLTIHQARIMFCYVMLVSLYAFSMGILNTLRIFWLPAVAPALWNLAVISGIFFFRKYFETPSDVMAWATVVGGVLQIAILLPSLIKNNFFPRFAKFWKNRAVWRVLKAMGPSVLGLSVMQLAVIINTYLASRLEQGSNSWIFWADRILELPLSLFAVSVGTAVLPSLSAMWSRGDAHSMRKTSLHSLRLTFFMALPCAAGTYFLAEPIIHVLFEHGRFAPHDTLMTGAILKVYGFGMIFAAGVRVLAPTFYAMKNTWLPALSASIALVCHVIIAQILIKTMGVVGLATSSVLSGGINFLILVLSYRLTGDSLRIFEIAPFLIKVLIGCVGLSFAGFYIYHYGIVYLGDSHLTRSLSLGLSIFIAGLVYFVICRALHIPELVEVSNKISSKFRAKISKK